jgi:hypothetical protein
MKDIQMKDYQNVPTPDLLLLVILELSGGGSGLCVEATIKNITEVLKQKYGRDVTRTRVEQILKDLESQRLIYKKRGLLRDRRVLVFSLNPDYISREVFTIIKYSGQAVIYDDNYIGTIYDTQSPHKIDCDLLTGLDETYHKLKIIRDEYFNKEPLFSGAISSNKVPGFGDWRPESKKLIEDLGKALVTATSAPQK